jgi:hypothetical protein
LAFAYWIRLFTVFRLHRAADDEDHRRLREHRHAAEILERVVGQLLEDRGVLVERVVGEKYRVAVGLRARRELGADDRRRVGMVLDQESLAELFLHAGRYQPRDDVGAAARRARNDHADELGRIGLGVEVAGDCGEQKQD